MEEISHHQEKQNSSKEWIISSGDSSGKMWETRGGGHPQPFLGTGVSLPCLAMSLHFVKGNQRGYLINLANTAAIRISSLYNCPHLALPCGIQLSKDDICTKFLIFFLNTLKHNLYHVKCHLNSHTCCDRVRVSLDTWEKVQRKKSSPTHIKFCRSQTNDRGILIVPPNLVTSFKW